jgi:hypothetical protein
MAKKQVPIPHIPLPFEAAVKEFLKVKPPKKGKTSTKPQPSTKPKKRKASDQ